MGKLEEAVNGLTSEEKKKLFPKGKVSWKNLTSILSIAKRVLENNSYEERLSVSSIRSSLKKAAVALENAQNKSQQNKLNEKLNRVRINGSLRNNDDVVITNKDNIPMVRHGPSSKLNGNITVDIWNSMKFVQISKPTGKCNAKSKSGWIRAKCMEAGDTLADSIWTQNTASKNTLVMFHGTIGRFESSFLKQISWRKGNGILGTGFYMSHNPNVAKAYACRTMAINGGPKSNEYCVVLELHVTRADKIHRVHFDTQEFGKPKVNKSTFVSNRLTKFDGQVCLRGVAINHVKVARMHLFNCKYMKSNGVDDTKPETC